MDTQIRQPPHNHYFIGSNYHSNVQPYSNSASASPSPPYHNHHPPPPTQNHQQSYATAHYQQPHLTNNYSSSLMLQVTSSDPAPHEGPAGDEYPPDFSHNSQMPLGSSRAEDASASYIHDDSSLSSSQARIASSFAGLRGCQHGVTRPLLQQEHDLLAHLDRLKFFLATAPSRWSDSEPSTKDSSASNSSHSDSSSSYPIGHPQSNHPALNRFLLPNHEYVSCVLWGGLYHITGTDIVRALVFRFEAFGRPVRNMKKFEEGVFSDLRNLKPGVDACLEEPKSPFLDLLFKYQCIRTQKKQKVFYWFSVPHDRLFLDALERDLKREKMGLEPTTAVLGEPALSFTYDPTRSLYEQFSKAQGGVEGEGELEAAVRRVDSQSRSQASRRASSTDGKTSPEMGNEEGTSSDEQYASDAQRNGSGKVASALRGSQAKNPFLSAISLFEGSPTYKQRRKKAQKVPRKALSSDPSHPLSVVQLSDPSSGLGLGLNLGLGAGLDSAHGHGYAKVKKDIDEMSAADMFFAQARGEMSPANPIEKEQERRIKIAQEQVKKVEALAAANEQQQSQPQPQPQAGSYQAESQMSMSMGSPQLAVTEQIMQSGAAFGTSTLSTQDGSIHRERPRVEQRYTHPLVQSSKYSELYHGNGNGINPNRAATVHQGHSPDHSQSIAVGPCLGDNIPMIVPRTFVCPLFSCGRLFKRMEHLKRHVRTHTMERPFQCTRCHKHFSRSDNLAQHTRIHMRADMDGGVGMGGLEDNVEDMEGSYEDVESEEIDELEGDDGGMPMYGPGSHVEQIAYMNEMQMASGTVNVNGMHGIDVSNVEGHAQAQAQGHNNVMGFPVNDVNLASGNGYVDGGQEIYYMAEAPGVADAAQFAQIVASPQGSPYMNGSSATSSAYHWMDMRNQSSPAFTSASAPSPQASQMPPVRMDRPRPLHSSSLPGVQYEYMTSASAPSHKVAFDQSSLYPPPMGYASSSSAGSGPIRRHRSATPSMSRTADDIRRPSSATMYGASNRGYHPYANAMAMNGHYTQSAHSSPASTTAPLDYVSGQNVPHPHAIPPSDSHSRHSSNGQLQEQMNQMLNLEQLEADAVLYPSNGYGEVYAHESPMQYGSGSGSYSSPRNSPPVYDQGVYAMAPSHSSLYVEQPASSSYYTTTGQVVEPQQIVM